MSTFRWLKNLFRNLSGKRRVEQELNDEISSYIEIATRRKIVEGMSEADARRAVLIELEGIEQTKERVRETRAGYRIDMFIQDLRFAFRSLRKAPVFTLTVIAVLAVGIGSTTLMFAVVDSVLLKDPPYPEADRLVTLWNRIPEEPRISFSPTEFAAWTKQTQVFETLAFVTGTGFTLSGGGDPEMIMSRMVSPSFFSVLQTGPFLGRAFRPEDGNQHLVILSYGFWREKFASRTDVIGESLTLNGEPYTVIGVMPRSFVFEQPDARLFVPVALESPIFSEHPDAHFLRVFGRLKPGITRQQLDAEIRLLGTRVDSKTDPTTRQYFALTLKDLTTGELRTPLLVLLSAVALLLLVACANVANLVLVRTNARQGEIALRAALGANRFRLVAQLLTESAVLACVGGILGLGLAIWALDLLTTSLGKSVPELTHVQAGTAAFAIVVITSAFTAAIFGLGPAWSAARTSFHDKLKNSSRTGGSRINTQQLLVFGEVAIAAALLSGCMLMIRSFISLIHVDPGFRPANVITADVFLSKDRYPNASKLFQFYRAAFENLHNAGRLDSAGMVTHLPFGGNSWGNSFDVEGNVPPPGVNYSAQIRPISPRYFETLGIRLIQGTGFTQSDDDKSRPVAVVNQALAKRFWPNESPIGKRIRFFRDWLTIIGVCGDIKHARLDAESDMEIYVPYLQLPGEAAQFVGRDMNYVVRSNRPGDAAAELRNALRSVDPQAVVKLNTMEGLIRESTAQPRFRTWLVSLFSGSALLLTCLGIYGVVAYLVTQRYKEIGIRLALGATRANILRLILGRTAVLAASGIAAGTLLALFLSRFFQSILFGISAHDPATFTAVAICLVVVALAAGYLPARRAARIDPVRSLRYE